MVSFCEAVSTVLKLRHLAAEMVKRLANAREQCNRYEFRLRSVIKVSESSIKKFTVREIQIKKLYMIEA